MVRPRGIEPEPAASEAAVSSCQIVFAVPLRGRRNRGMSHHVANLLPGVGRMGRPPEVVITLKVQPKLRRRVESLGEAQGHVGRHRAATVENLVQGLSRDSQALGDGGNREV